MYSKRKTARDARKKSKGRKEKNEKEKRSMIKDCI
jgi:hypothetical protein